MEEESTKRTVSEICQDHFRHFFTPTKPSTDPPKRSSAPRSRIAVRSVLHARMKFWLHVGVFSKKKRNFSYTPLHGKPDIKQCRFAHWHGSTFLKRRHGSTLNLLCRANLFTIYTNMYTVHEM